MKVTHSTRERQFPTATDTTAEARDTTRPHTLTPAHQNTFEHTPEATATNLCSERAVLFIAAVTVLAVVWSRFFRRGPLEYLLGRATEPARYVK
ncbi:DUF418 domain-containing protein [Streptomyces phaeochromogenes]|uniref:DUF418 domain-containing protein n=1 Tax=Streptomyces phaeochromogenes TaxID=1923 RepID=A0ABZ1HHU7_STRPH|nr:hypothetical protein [Streptomyces phaeochromogenes]WSD17111.1 DUF418 domain-containing protein [Streptomyces phaeochromogenes]WSJ06083.1 DUF418 domain-containing protein [Streptomyces phaeochromogenes]